MLKLTEVAQEKIREAISNNKEPVLGIRVLADARSPFQINYGLAFVSDKGVNEDDHISEFEGFNIYVAKDMEQYFEGATLDFKDGLHGSGFAFIDTPRVPKEYKGTLAEKVVKVIDEEINPGIASHGGYVTLVDVKGTDVIIQMGGGCQGCGMANVTLKDGIEVALKKALPEITGVFDVTDHASGKNPYYAGE
jgi:Fe/S biogenesis protein NfuA